MQQIPATKAPPLRSLARTACCAVVAALTLTDVSLAATPHAKAKPARDQIYGVWLGIGFVTGDLGPWHNTNWAPKPSQFFTPWGAAESKRLGDPQTSKIAYCRPAAINQAQNLFPVEFLKAKDHIVQLIEGGSVPRRIYTDGRKHPTDLSPAYLGNSVAHWEGDTLVVDTIGTRGGGNKPLNGFASNVVYAVEGDSDPRLPTSDQLHFVERIRVVNDGQVLEIKTTVDDPKVYTRSFSRTEYLQRRPDLDMQELYCEGDQRPDSEGYIRQSESR